MEASSPPLHCTLIVCICVTVASSLPLLSKHGLGRLIRRESLCPTRVACRIKVYLGGWHKFDPPSSQDQNCLCRRCCPSPQTSQLPCPSAGPQLESIENGREQPFSSVTVGHQEVSSYSLLLSLLKGKKKKVSPSALLT